MKTLKYLATLFILMNSFLVFASDLDRERRLTQEVLAGFIDGEAIFLSHGENKFLALHTETDLDSKKGLVIMLHGRGLHSNWHNVIQPVRAKLPEFGWDTLSLQMPVLDKDASIANYFEILPSASQRIDEAIYNAQQLGYQNIYLLGHNCGSQMIIEWLNQQSTPIKKISGIINISLGIETYYRIHNKYPTFNKINVPILDVYAENGILNKNAVLRKSLIDETGNNLTQQIKIKAANDMFEGHGATLSTAIKDWLKSIKEPLNART